MTVDTPEPTLMMAPRLRSRMPPSTIFESCSAGRWGGRCGGQGGRRSGGAATHALKHRPITGKGALPSNLPWWASMATMSATKPSSAPTQHPLITKQCTHHGGHEGIDSHDISHEAPIQLMQVHTATQPHPPPRTMVGARALMATMSATKPSSTSCRYSGWSYDKPALFTRMPTCRGWVNTCFGPGSAHYGASLAATPRNQSFFEAEQGSLTSSPFSAAPMRAQVSGEAFVRSAATVRACTPYFPSSSAAASRSRDSVREMSTRLRPGVT